MKLKFLVFQTTDIDPQIIPGLINLKLKDKKYRIQGVTDNSVTFDDDPWVLMWNHQAIRRLDGGVFKISVSDNGITVSLNYYLNLMPIVLMLVGLSIMSVSTMQDYNGIIFFFSFFSIAITIQCFISKEVARELLAEILSENAFN